MAFLDSDDPTHLETVEKNSGANCVFTGVIHQIVLSKDLENISFIPVPILV